MKNQEKLETENEKELEPITFTALVTDDTNIGKWGDDPVSREITRRTGVSLEIITLSGDIDKQIEVMLASQDYPDILLSVTHENVQAFAKEGHLVSFNDYIDNNDTEVEKNLWGRSGTNEECVRRSDIRI